MADTENAPAGCLRPAEQAGGLTIFLVSHWIKRHTPPALPRRLWQGRLLTELPLSTPSSILCLGGPSRSGVCECPLHAASALSQTYAGICEESNAGSTGLLSTDCHAW